MSRAASSSVPIRRAGAWHVPVERCTRAELTRRLSAPLRAVPVSQVIRKRANHWVVPREVGLPWSSTNETVCPKARKLTHRIKLRSYQTAAVAKAVRKGFGVLVAPCGSGKTTMGCALVAHHATAAVVLVHTRDLVDQWTVRVRRELGVTAGQGTGSKARVVIATVQAVSAMSAGRRAAFGRRFGLVVVDEAHHVPAATWGQVMTDLPARHRYGLTATPDRMDGLDPLMLAHLGPVVARTSVRELERSGCVVAPSVRFVLTHRSGTKEHDPVRDALIARLVSAERKGKRRTLVLVRHVSHAEELADALGRKARALVGPRSPTARRQALDAFRSGKVNVLVATSLADEGLDLPELDTVMLATPTASMGRVVQRVGRVMRPNGRMPLVLDLVDDDARTAAFARERLYQRHGWSIEISTPGRSR